MRRVVWMGPSVVAVVMVFVLSGSIAVAEDPPIAQNAPAEKEAASPADKGNAPAEATPEKSVRELVVEAEARLAALKTAMDEGLAEVESAMRPDVEVYLRELAATTIEVNTAIADAKRTGPAAYVKKAGAVRALKEKFLRDLAELTKSD